MNLKRAKGSINQARLILNNHARRDGVLIPHGEAELLREILITADGQRKTIGRLQKNKDESAKYIGRLLLKMERMKTHVKEVNTDRDLLVAEIGRDRWIEILKENGRWD